MDILWYVYVTWLPVLFACCWALLCSISQLNLRLCLCMVCMGLVFTVSIANASVFYHLRGLLSEPSWALVGFSLLYLARELSNRQLQKRTVYTFSWAVVFFGYSLYPLALGLTYMDSYALGYEPWVALVLAGGLLLAWWFTRTLIVPLWLTTALFAYAYQFGESPNLWDYIIDPFAFIVAHMYIARSLWAHYKKRREVIE